MKTLWTLSLLSLASISLSLPGASMCKAENQAGLDGVAFSQDVRFSCESSFQETLSTLEAHLKIDPNRVGDSGVLFANYTDGTGNDFAISVNASGHPLVTCVQNGNLKTTEFASDLRSSDYVHLALTFTNESLSCYVNGTLVSSKAGDFVPYLKGANATIGGDNRTDNASYFRGYLSDIALYDEVRTAEEIQADSRAIDLTDLDLFAYYDLNGKQDHQVFKNEAYADYDFYSSATWIENDFAKEMKPYAYSMAVIGDIQYTNRDYPDLLPKIFDYIADNAESQNIQYAFGMGDNTDKDTDAEWERAVAMYHKLDGKVGYSIVCGNHDSLYNFDRYFNTSDYRSTFAGSYLEERAEATYRFLTIGKVKYLIMTLSYGPSDQELAWASKIVDAYSDYQVIVTTHSYLDRNGDFHDESKPYAPSHDAAFNNGDQIWEKFTSQHKNITLVLCGHEHSEYLQHRQDVGVNGNVVTSILVDSQDLDWQGGVDGNVAPVGAVAMLYFNEDGSFVQTDYYSPIKEKHLHAENWLGLRLYDGLEYQGAAKIKTIQSGETPAAIAFDRESYSIGDPVSFQVKPKSGCYLDGVSLNGSTIHPIDSDGNYFFVAQKKNELSVCARQMEQTSGPELPLGIGLTVGGILLSGAAVAFTLIKRKKSC